MDRGIDLFRPLEQALRIAPDRASTVAAAQGGLGALLASMAFRDLADEGREQAPYDRGRAEELEHLAELLLKTPERQAQLRAREARRAEAGSDVGQSETVSAEEHGVELAEFAVAALRLVALADPAARAPLARDLLTAAQALEHAALLALELAGGGGAEPGGVKETGEAAELAAAAEVLGREARTLSGGIRAAGAAHVP